MTRQRIRLRFRKYGDLRLIGHRDLARTIERWMRRADLPLQMSEGFHPKARLSFPSALGVGIEGAQEVMEVEFRCPVAIESVLDRLREHAPVGLEICQAELVSTNASKAHIVRVTYTAPVPPQRRAAVQAAIVRLLAEPEYLIHRPGKSDPLDLRADIERIELVDGVLSIVQKASRESIARPREILAALDLDDLEEQGKWLTRSNVELAS